MKKTKKTQRPKKPVPFEFVLDLLGPESPFTKPMFGCVGVYVGEKIVFILRHRPTYPNDNGVWIATLREHHASLKKDIPSLRSIRLFGGDETEWQNIPMSSSNFERDVTVACELFLKGDIRVGKVPNSKAKKSKSKLRAKAKTSKIQSTKKVVTWAELQTRV